MGDDNYIQYGQQQQQHPGKHENRVVHFDLKNTVKKIPDPGGGTATATAVGRQLPADARRRLEEMASGGGGGGGSAVSDAIKRYNNGSSVVNPRPVRNGSTFSNAHHPTTTASKAHGRDPVQELIASRFSHSPSATAAAVARASAAHNATTTGLPPPPQAAAVAAATTTATAGTGRFARRDSSAGSKPAGSSAAAVGGTLRHLQQQQQQQLQQLQQQKSGSAVTRSTSSRSLNLANGSEAANGYNRFGSSETVASSGSASNNLAQTPPAQVTSSADQLSAADRKVRPTRSSFWANWWRF